MADSRGKPLDALRTKVRRIQLVVGLGFGSLVLGVVLTFPILSRPPAVPEALRLPFAGLVENVWVWLVLPVVSYGLSRVLELRPWPTALGAAGTGLVFKIAVDVVSDGFDTYTRAPGRSLLRLAFIVAGTFLTAVAVRRGRAAASRAEQAASQKAATVKSQYDVFAEEARRLAERRESVPIATGVAAVPAAEQGSGRNGPGTAEADAARASPAAIGAAHGSGSSPVAATASDAAAESGPGPASNAAMSGAGARGASATSGDAATATGAGAAAAGTPDDAPKS